MREQGLEQAALQVHPEDEVAVALVPVAAGTRVQVGGRSVTLTGPVAPGHRFTLVDVAAGRPLRQYGVPFGTSRGLAAGDPVTRERLDDTLPPPKPLPAELHNEAPPLLPEEEVPRFPGYRRPDGRVGIRNLVAVVPTSMCASHEAVQVALQAELRLLDAGLRRTVDGVVALPHDKGCGCSEGDNLDVLLRSLANSAAHPNVGGVLFLDLGCEKTDRAYLAAFLERHGGLGWDKPVAWIGIQEAGGTAAAIARGVEAVAAMLPRVAAARRQEVPAGELVLGVKCGGSDGFSGISANPALGAAADRLVRCGGTVLMTEVPEFCGAEHVLAARARNARVAREVLELVAWYRAHAARAGARLDDNPSPGNVAGGLLNIALKSLGAVAKGGTTPVMGVTAYATPPRGRGLHLMQGPGYDQVSTPGLVAAGAQVVVFTTGRGTTIGNALAPVIKLASNDEVAGRMARDLDLSAGGVLNGRETVPEVGSRVFRRILEVAGGARTRAEETGHREFQVWSAGAVHL